jgi:hypothetical protein
VVGVTTLIKPVTVAGLWVRVEILNQMMTLLVLVLTLQLSSDSQRLPRLSAVAGLAETQEAQGQT